MENDQQQKIENGQKIEFQRQPKIKDDIKNE